MFWSFWTWGYSEQSEYPENQNFLKIFNILHDHLNILIILSNLNILTILNIQDMCATV